MKQEKLIKIRNEYGYSQYKMAELLGIAQGYYCELEKGKKNLFYDLAIRIASIFGKKPDDLFYIEKSNRNKK